MDGCRMYVTTKSAAKQNCIVSKKKRSISNELKDIPDNLLGYYNKKQLEIIFVEEDLRSHKKYYYAFKEYQNDIIITIDDDIFIRRISSKT